MQPYKKPPLTYQDQLAQLQARGLNVTSDPRALHLLETISYYRLSGYWYPLLDDKKAHVFKATASLETAFSLYCFDRELRNLITSELEKVEIAVRAKMIYILSHKYGPFWFADPQLFSRRQSFDSTLSKVDNEYIRSDEEFIKAFRKNYTDPYPPSWMILEVVSFGTLSMLYKNLNPGRDKREISNHFGLNDSVFASWLHSMVYLRNVCAHHTRLWNREMQISPQLPMAPKKIWLSNLHISRTRAYFMFSVIKFLLQTVNPASTFREKLIRLFTKYPMVDIRALDFPLNWETEPLWKY